MAKAGAEGSRSSGILTGLLIALLLVALPVAVWMDLINLGDATLRRQATDLNSVVTSVREYYGANVVRRVLAAPGVTTQVVHNYEMIPGAIPIPATLSLELGRVISDQQQNITYRFVSDFPFKNRPTHRLDDFETNALKTLRDSPNQKIVESSRSIVQRSRAACRARDHGTVLCELSQHAPGKPQA